MEETQKPVVQHRESNLELFRIIVMILIIVHHYVVNSGLTLSDGVMFVDSFSPKTLFLLLFGAWGKTGINCFVLITGYFMCQKSITAKKFFQLLFEVYFYRIVIHVVFLATGYEPFTWMNFAKMILPFTSLTNNFTGCFLVFYLTIPFLTILVRHMDEKMHLRLLLLIFALFVIFASIPKMSVSFSYISWFICLFFIASYIRLYPKKVFQNTKLWGWLSLGILLVSSASVVALYILGPKLGRNSLWYYFLADSNKILAVLTAIIWFLFFKNVKIKYSRIINALGGATFGVLLIHAHSDFMRQWLWGDVLNNVGMYSNGNWIYLHSIASVLSIFLICAIIDIVRKHTVEKWFMKVWNPLLDKAINWFNNKELKLFKKDEISTTKEE